MTSTHAHAYFGGDNQVVAVAAGLHPVAEDGFGFATNMASHPRRIDISSINKITATRHKGVEHGKGTVAVCGPPQHIAPKTNRGDI